MNPIESVRAWVDGVGHHERTQLYAALCIEESKEILESITHPSETMRKEIIRGIGVMDGVSYSLRQVGYMEADKAELLDAALDTAWVALCLAYTIAGDSLPQAWAELHRSNVVDKQVDGSFIKDETGKVRKPASWTPPNFAQFVKP